MDELVEVKRLGVIANLPANTTKEVGRILALNCRTLVVSAKVTYHGSATSGVTIKFYVYNEEVGIDTVPYTSFALTLDAGETVQRSVMIDAPEARTLQVKATNNDGSYAATDIIVGYSMRRWKNPV